MSISQHQYHQTTKTSKTICKNNVFKVGRNFRIYISNGSRAGFEPASNGQYFLWAENYFVKPLARSIRPP